jgi:guanylate kinase
VQDAAAYIHVSRGEFEAGVSEGNFLEHVTGPGDGHLYGTARRSVEDVLRSGKVGGLGCACVGCSGGAYLCVYPTPV